MNLNEFAVKFCENNSCYTCPVYLNNFETRSEKDQKDLHIPCSENLLKWLQCATNSGE